MKIIFNNIIREFDDDLLELSPSLKNIYETINREPIRLNMNIDDEKIYNIFKTWFDKYKQSPTENRIFEAEYFMQFDAETLYDMLKFANFNRINLLSDTLCYVMSKKFDIVNDSEKYYLTEKNNTLNRLCLITPLNAQNIMDVEI